MRTTLLTVLLASTVTSGVAHAQAKLVETDKPKTSHRDRPQLPRADVPEARDWNDPEVREGILRFVREGGGIGGHHAVTFANNHWPEFADMMGGWAGAHLGRKVAIRLQRFLDELIEPRVAIEPPPCVRRLEHRFRSRVA